MRRSLTDDAAKIMVHLFVINRIDYCNSVLYGKSAVHMRQLQNVLNSAARMVLKMSKFQHITAAVRDQLHWLPVKQRVKFKQALFVYKVLRQTAPPYLADICQPVSTSSTRRHLRSAAHGDLVELRCRTTRYTESKVFPRLLH